jgi:hypothetical protein
LKSLAVTVNAASASLRSRSAGSTEEWKMSFAWAVDEYGIAGEHRRQSRRGRGEVRVKVGDAPIDRLQRIVGLHGQQLRQMACDGPAEARDRSDARREVPGVPVPEVARSSSNRAVRTNPLPRVTARYWP